MTEFMKNIEDAIRNAPTIDTVEQKHGHWIRDTFRKEPMIPNKRGEYEWVHTAKCSVCGREIGISKGYPDYPYCMFCGAKMDEVTE